MKVLHIHSGNLYGGVETVLVTLARARDLSPDLESTFALCYEDKLASDLRASGATPIALPTPRASRPWTVSRSRESLRRALGDLVPDAVICHAPWALAMFGAVVRRQGVPLVLWLHGPVAGRNWLERWARRTPPDLVIANSAFTEKSTTSLYPSVPSVVVRTPVVAPEDAASTTRQEIRRELHTADDSTVIIQVSRMEPWKGHLLHVEALAALENVPQWTCWMVGGAQRPSEIRYFESIRNRARELGIEDRVRFTGHREDVPDLLSAADIFCQPNTAPEPFGIVFIEAMYAGLPVVSTDMGGAAEIVDESSGLLVEPDDASALAKVLRGLITNAEDRARIASGARDRGRALCDPATQLNQLAEALKRVI